MRLGSVAVVVAGFLGWRMLRPLEIFSISRRFEDPLPMTPVPPLDTLSAESCGSCHRTIHHEWSTTVHGHARTDRYFQTDWRAEGRKQISPATRRLVRWLQRLLP